MRWCWVSQISDEFMCFKIECNNLAPESPVLVGKRKPTCFSNCCSESRYIYIYITMFVGETTILVWPCFNQVIWLVVWNIFLFPYIGNNNPNWLIFFRWVETTNQSCFFVVRPASIWLPAADKIIFCQLFFLKHLASSKNIRNIVLS